MKRIIDLPRILSQGKAGLIIADIEEVTKGLFNSAPRVYFVINDTDSESFNGGHYHKEGGKLEVFVCLRGSVEVELHGTENCEVFVLDQPNKALVIPSTVWHAVKLSPQSTLVAIASTKYEIGESIPEKFCACEKI